MNKFDLISKIEKAGYCFNDEQLKQLVGLFYEAGLRVGGMVPATLLTGLPGAGKTFLAECFAKAIDAEVIFYQITEDTNSSVLVGDINPAEVVRGNAGGAVSDGALIKACRAEKPIVLILDEWDKGASELDAFLLDFLQSRRIRDLNGEMQYLPEDQMWVFLTSNGDRDVSDALSRRLRKWEIEKLSADVAAEILGIPHDHQLLVLWEGIPELALSQLEEYIQDMGGPENLPEDIDTVVLGQYINIPRELQKKVSSEDEDIVLVEVSARDDYWDIEEALMGRPVHSSYINHYERTDITLTFRMKDVADWLDFSNHIGKMVQMDSHLTITAKTSEGIHDTYIPLEVIEHLSKKVNVYDDKVAFITRNGKFAVGNLKNDVVNLDSPEITDLFKRS